MRSRSSTTWTSTGSVRRRWSPARPPRSSTSRPASPGATRTSGPEILVASGIRLVDDVGPGRHARAQRRRPARPRRTASCASATRSSPRACVGRVDRLGCDGAGPRRLVRPAGGVRREHDGVPAAGARSPARRRRRAGHHDRARGPARPRRGPRLPLQGGPADAAPLHPRVPAGADRRRRWRGRAHRGRVPAPPDRGRHGLGLGRGAHLRRRDRRARLPRRSGTWPGAGTRARRRAGGRSRPPAPARTSPCCSRTTRAPA